jgi:asparagine synthase (glutamine-hydrolysing)
MCGICGVISSDPRPVEPAVRAMMRAMVHRGPDDEGFELLPMGHGDAPSPVVGLGFRRLSILDLSSAGHQPMFNERTGDCLVFNGEIYNFRQLRAQLQCEGVVFRSTSDTEVLLQALCTWGDSAVERLQGMFAFAFYHADSRRILLARDPLGIKPLYVAQLPNAFVFASEIRAARASGLVPSEFDIGGVASMLAYGAVQSPLTIYKSIRSFPAGSTQWIDESACRGIAQAPPRRFWNFPQRSLTGIDRPTAISEVRRLLRDAVFRHLVADVPVGVFLSAGIDSTILTSFAREYTPQVTAFTVGFGSITLNDESEIAARTAKSLGIRHVAVQVDASALPDTWRAWMSQLDSPSIDGFNTYLVSRQLAAEGVVVGLSGLGADEMFGGYNLFDRAPRLSRLVACLAFVPRSVRAAVVKAIARINRRKDVYDKLGDLAAGRGGIAGVTRSLRRTLADRRLAALGLPPTVTGLGPDYLVPDSDRWEPKPAADAFNTVSQVEMINYMGDTLLRDTDANGMRHSLEVRVPFLDLPFVNFVSALPGTLKSAGGAEIKALLREAGQEVLSEEVIARPKTGFTLPIGFWMRKQMREDCEAAIQSLEQVPFLDAKEIRSVWSNFLADGDSMHWSRPLALVVLGHAIRSTASH